MAILTVGSGETYSTISAAIAAAQNGDTINVDAGTYTNDYASINKNITLQGVGGRVEMVSTGPIPNGKAIFVTNGDIIINNFDFSGAQVPDENGAGIKEESGNLVLNNDGFFNNQMGVLTGNINTTTLTVNNSEFAYNGVDDPNSGHIGHGLYAGNIQSLTINNSYFHEDSVGHELKSRALNTIIQNSRIYDLNATASLNIDLPNGGNATIQNNVIEQGPNSQNNKIIDYGEEGNLNPGTNFVISDNTILNDRTGSPLAVWNATTGTTAQITNNKFYGLTSSQIVSGPNTQSGNQFLTTEPALNTSHPWSQTGSSSPPPTQTGSGSGSSSTPPTQTGSSSPPYIGTTFSDITKIWSFTPAGFAPGTYGLTATQTNLTNNTGAAAPSFMFNTQMPFATDPGLGGTL